MGEEPEKVDVCLCIIDSLCCTPETDNTVNPLYPNIKFKLENKSKKKVPSPKNVKKKKVTTAYDCEKIFIYYFQIFYK